MPNIMPNKSPVNEINFVDNGAGYQNRQYSKYCLFIVVLPMQLYLCNCSYGIWH